MIYLIPDTQTKPGVRNPLIPIAYHICSVKPRYVIHGGDHWDFPSLSIYDKGKKSHRTKSYLADIRAGNKAMDEFWEIIISEWPECKSKCNFILLQGNHEFRRERALEYGPDELIELINEFKMDINGWDKIIPFMSVYELDGIYFSHYFSNMNNQYAICTARALIQKKHSSCIAFHKQGFQYSEQIAEQGKIIQSMIIGSCYFHNETYKNHNNHHWRGVVVLSNVNNGMYDLSRCNLKSLDKYYMDKYKYSDKLL